MTTQNENPDAILKDPIIEALAARYPRLFQHGYPEAWSDLPKGWEEVMTGLLSDLDQMLSDADAAGFKILQVKEKFAGLRVYWRLGQEKATVIDLIGEGSIRHIYVAPDKPSELFLRITDRVREAVAVASHTCQLCGSDGAKRGGSRWLSTLCDSCRSSQSQE